MSNIEFPPIDNSSFPGPNLLYGPSGLFGSLLNDANKNQVIKSSVSSQTRENAGIGLV